jgi:hypothetical protein
MASAIASLGFVLPFLYAPLILVEGRGGVGASVLESARLVAREGALPHFALSLTANAVQVAPLLIAVLSASWFSQSDSAPLWALLSLPLLALSVPLGQGMLVAAYVERRAELADLRRTRLAGRPPRGLIAAWLMITAAPLLSFSMLGASCVRPSRVPAVTCRKAPRSSPHSYRYTQKCVLVRRAPPSRSSAASTACAWWPATAVAWAGCRCAARPRSKDCASLACATTTGSSCSKPDNRT